MGVTRDSAHKRRHTGGKRVVIRKKRKFLMARPGAFTKLGEKRIHLVRTMGGNTKFRAMRLDAGNFSWGSEAITKKVRILDVTYNATNNELLRTKTLVKGCIVQIDGTPFRQWYEKHYGVEATNKKAKKKKDETEEAATTQSGHVKAKLRVRQKTRTPLDTLIQEQFNSGRLYARVTSRPGQSGRCDGQILEGEELKFYKRMMDKKKKN